MVVVFLSFSVIPSRTRHFFGSSQNDPKAVSYIFSAARKMIQKRWVTFFRQLAKLVFWERCFHDSFTSVSETRDPAPESVSNWGKPHEMIWMTCFFGCPDYSRIDSSITNFPASGGKACPFIKHSDSEKRSVTNMGRNGILSLMAQWILWILFWGFWILFSAFWILFSTFWSFGFYLVLFGISLGGEYPARCHSFRPMVTNRGT